METCIVIPCYNEEKRLPFEAYRRFIRTSREITLLFVDDGSTDSTRVVLDTLAREFARVVSVTSLQRNSGKAEAVRRGMNLAIKNGFNHAGYWDADLATPLEAIYEFVDVLGRHPCCELVIGSRLSLLGRAIHREPRRARLGHLFSKVASLTLGIHVRDTQCGAKLFRVNDRLSQVFATPFHSKWIFDIEILARLKCLIGTSRGLSQKIYELPLEAWEDIAESKLGLRDMLMAPIELAKISSNYFMPWSSHPFSAAPAETIEPAKTIPFPNVEPSLQVPIRNAA